MFSCDFVFVGSFRILNSVALCEAALGSSDPPGAAPKRPARF